MFRLFFNTLRKIQHKIIPDSAFCIQKATPNLPGVAFLNAEFGMRNAEFGMRNDSNSEFGMRNSECGMWNAEFGMRNSECGMRNAECGMRNAECKQSLGSDKRAPFYAGLY